MSSPFSIPCLRDLIPTPRNSASSNHSTLFHHSEFFVPACLGLLTKATKTQKNGLRFLSDLQLNLSRDKNTIRLWKASSFVIVPKRTNVPTLPVEDDPPLMGTLTRWSRGRTG
ncbi:hypothetical protein ONZ45_g14385 [Pleurotus djamor]|nr:hypothetical protein ONZ45_g14385 [Pleurotus djamor]